MLWMEVGSLRRRPILLIPADLLWRARDRGPDTTPQTRSQASPKLHPRSRNWRDTVHLLAQRLPQICLNTFFRGGRAFESKQKTCANYFSSRPWIPAVSGNHMCSIWGLDPRQHPSTAIVFDCLPARGKSWLDRQSWNTFVWERGTRRCLTEEDGLDENSLKMERIAALIMR